MIKGVFNKKSIALSILFAFAGVSQSVNACCVNLCPQCEQSKGESSSYKDSLKKLEDKTKKQLDDFKENTKKGLEAQGKSVSYANSGMAKSFGRLIIESNKTLINGIHKLKNRVMANNVLKDGSMRNAPPNDIDMSNEYLACAYKEYPEKVWKKQVVAGVEFINSWKSKNIGKRIRNLASDEDGTAGSVVEQYIESDPSELTMGDAIVLSDLAVSGYDKVGNEPEVSEVINEPTRGQKALYESTRKLVKLKVEAAKKGIEDAISIKNAYAPVHEAVFNQSLSSDVYLKELNKLMVGKENHFQTKLRMIEQLSMRNTLAMEELQRLMSELNYRAVYYADNLSDKERNKMRNLKKRTMGEIGVEQ